MAAISFLNCLKASLTALGSFNGTTMVSSAKDLGIPAYEVSPKVTKPETDFTNKLSTWQW
jgi:hypothetical protein